MKWRDATMFEAIKHASGREPQAGVTRPDGADFDYDVVCFTDKTAVAVRSTWDGPFSKVTPDISAGDPVWRIYD